MFQQNQVNVMAADALAAGVGQTSVPMAITLLDEWVMVFHEEGFQQPAPLYCWQEMRYIPCFAQ